MIESDEKQPPSYFSSPLQNYGGNILYLTNPDSELHKLELTLRNEVEDDNGELHSRGEPLLNEEGVRSVIGLVQSIVNQVTIMSSLQDWEVESIGDMLADTLARDLMVNRKRYGITNASARDKVFFSVLSTARITMNRGRNESDKRFWKGSTQEITTKVDTTGQRRGFSLFPFGRR